MRKIPKSKFPQIAENRAQNTLARKLKAIIEEWQPLLKVNYRRDDQIDDNLFDRLLYQLDDALNSWQSELRAAGIEANVFLKQQFIRQFKTHFGTDPRMNEFWADEELKTFVDNVMRRCKGSNQEIVGKMRKAHAKARKRGTPAADLDRELDGYFKLLNTRYKFAIRDEFGDYVSNVTERRHRAFGLDKYTWRDRRDRRVRGNPAGIHPNAKYSHWHRNGDVYSYDDPPPDGNPGEPSGCRCMAEPVFGDQGQKNLGLWAYFLAGAATGAAKELSENPA